MARGRKAMTLDEKIENAKTSDPTQAQTDFINWLKESTGVKVDPRSVILAQKLYNEFLGTPAAATAIAERKAEAAKKAAERNEKAREAFLKRAAKLGYSVAKVETPAEVTEDSDGEDVSDEDAE